MNRISIHIPLVPRHFSSFPRFFRVSPLVEISRGAAGISTHPFDAESAEVAPKREEEVRV